MYQSTDWRTIYPSADYTIQYTHGNGYTIYRTFKDIDTEPPELDPGDTSALDNFLGGFVDAEK